MKKGRISIMKKKLLSTFLTIIMAMQLIVVPAHAAGFSVDWSERSFGSFDFMTDDTNDWYYFELYKNGTVVDESPYSVWETEKGTMINYDFFSFSIYENGAGNYQVSISSAYIDDDGYIVPNNDAVRSSVLSYNPTYTATKVTNIAYDMESSTLSWTCNDSSISEFAIMYYLTYDNSDYETMFFDIADGSERSFYIDDFIWEDLKLTIDDWHEEGGYYDKKNAKVAAAIFAVPQDIDTCAASKSDYFTFPASLLDDGEMFEFTLPDITVEQGGTVDWGNIYELVPSEMRFGLVYASDIYEEYITKEPFISFTPHDLDYSKYMSMSFGNSILYCHEVDADYSISFPIPEDMQTGDYSLEMKLYIAQEKNAADVLPYKITVDKFTVTEGDAVPTEAPTTAPTAAPTATPTPEPTIEPTPVPTPDAKYLDTIKVAYDLKIMPDVYSYPKSNVTKGEFAKILTHLTGGDSRANSMASSNCYYTDVTQDLKGYVLYVDACGLLSPDSSAVFGVDSEMTYEQIIKALTSVTGYAEIAQSYGGWPTGYISVAARTGLLKNFSAMIGSKITYQELSVLIYNTLKSKLLEQTSWGYEPVYEESDYNVAQEYLGLGIFNGTPLVSPKASEGYVRLAGTYSTFDTPKGYSVMKTSYVLDNSVYDLYNKGVEAFLNSFGDVLSVLPYDNSLNKVTPLYVSSSGYDDGRGYAWASVEALKDCTVALIIASYNQSGSLASLKMDKRDLSAGQTASLQTHALDNLGNSIKTFIWDMDTFKEAYTNYTIE